MKKKSLTFMVIFIASLLGFGLFQWQSSTASDTTLKTKKQITRNISPGDGLTLIDKNKNDPNFIVLDVRTPREYDPEHISGAMNLDYYSQNFRPNLKQLDKAKTYLIYCRSGRRSSATMDMMRELGFSEVYNIVGGMSAWKANGLPYLVE